MVTIRPATSRDADTLVRQRRGMFLEMGHDDPDELDCMEAAFRAYLGDALASGGFEGWIAEEGHRPVGGIGLVLYRLPPSCKNPSGIVAYAMSLFVEPESRRHGIASGLVRTVIERAREQGIEVVALHASDAGRAVYAPFGFRDTPEMRLHLREP
jgi:GNAT superfamily N-acetyltransferase